MSNGRNKEAFETYNANVNQWNKKGGGPQPPWRQAWFCVQEMVDFWSWRAAQPLGRPAQLR
ncbi:hypothetical protein A2U01_0036840, partial [Trifolium medium]|nr:hypothetical protein [Trifolium medium]